MDTRVPGETTVGEPHPWTEVRLKACCSKWQARLRLQDWDIEIKWEKRANMRTSHIAGWVNCDYERKLATVKVVHPREHPDDDDLIHTWPDTETTVVHELLHVKMWGIDVFEAGSDKGKLQEQCIEQIARALVAGYGGES